MNIVYFPHAIFSSVLSITQLSDMQPSHNIVDITEFAAGQVGPQFHGTAMASPDNRFSTPQLKSLLDACVAGDYNVCRDLSGTSVDMEFKAGENRGSRLLEAALSHIRLRMTTNAMICWESITARQGANAEARCRVVAAFDGTNDPMVATASVALNGTSAINALFTLGPIVLNGTTHQGVQEADWVNNNTYLEEGAEGDGFPSFVSLDTYAPVLTFRTRDLSLLSTYGRSTALSALTFYLRKKLASGINVPNATAEHIAFTADQGTIKARHIAGAKPMAEVSVHLNLDAASTPAFEIDTTAAIA
jgi:hypothetical protein